MREKPTVSCIIPAFNEERTVANVVETALSSGLFEEVICVNDGSQDQTLKILKSFGKKITLINFKKNYGKGTALATGIKKAKGEIVVFLDADLVNLRKKYLEKIINPLLKKKAEVVLGSLASVAQINPFSKLTGERAYFRQDLLPCYRQLRKKGFGAEVFLNNFLKNKKTKIIYLKGLKMLYKPQKIGVNQEMINAYLKEALEVSQELVNLQKGSVQEKIKMQRKIVKRFLNQYIKRTKEIEELLTKSKAFQKLKKLLEL